VTAAPAAGNAGTVSNLEIVAVTTPRKGGYHMVAIFAILLVIVVYRLVRSMIEGRTWPWLIALIVLLIMIASVL
jgi:hypothetical protein